MDMITEFLYHHEARKNRENLTSRASHESQGIVKPIALAQDQLFVLRYRGLELWEGQPQKDNHDDGDATSNCENGLKRKMQGFPGDENDAIGRYLRHGSN